MLETSRDRVRESRLRDVDGKVAAVLGMIGTMINQSVIYHESIMIDHERD